MSSPYRTFSFYTLGCKLNFSESSFLTNQLIANGYSEVKSDELADIYIINTCSVTENADKKANKFIKKLNDRSPDSFIIVIGCYAQLKPEEIKKIKGVSLVLGTEDKFDLLNYIEKDNLDNNDVSNKNINDAHVFNIAYSSQSRTRSYLKIQDGCDYLCSYCTIPMARGKSRSGDIADIINATHEINKLNIKEIVLTGVNIGDYSGNNGESFFDLIQTIDSLPITPRFRISSIEPNLLSEEMIDFILKSNKFTPHFHIPMQSGSDKVLKDMKRRYNLELYKDRVDYIRRHSNQACIGADVIVGFPTENNSDFIDTTNFINNLDINYLHVFPYSDRTNTISKSINEKVCSSKIKNRSKILREISNAKKKVFINRNINKKREILLETFDDGYLSGLTENYIKVNIKGSNKLVNSLQPIKISSIIDDEVYGDILA